MTNAVEPIPGEHLRFYVRSRTNPRQQYLVDLMAMRMNGQCGCDDFAFRKGPAFRLHPVPSDATRCIHIRAVREWLLNRMLGKLDAHMHAVRLEKFDRRKIPVDN